MASNRDWGVAPSAFTTPPFAGPNDPAITFASGADLPPALVAFYAGLGYNLVSVEIYRGDANNYTYQALVEIPGVVFFMDFGAADGLGIHRAITITQGVTSAIVSFGTAFVQIGGPLEIDGVSAGRGLRDFVSSVANTAAIAAETVVLTGNVITWTAGRCYRVEMHQLSTSAGGATLALFNVRRTNLAGAIKLGESITINGGGVTTCQFAGLIRNATGANISDRIVATMASFPAGTVTGNGAATTVRWLKIDDIGDAAAYPNVIQI